MPTVMLAITCSVAEPEEDDSIVNGTCGPPRTDRSGAPPVPATTEGKATPITSSSEIAVRDDERRKMVLEAPS